MEGEVGGGGEVATRLTAAVVGERYCSEEEMELTVRKTSLFHPGDGFDAYDHSTGDLVFRMDNYGARGPTLSEQLLLMDPSGEPILTLRRKWPSLHQRWEGFTGERCEGQKPLFTMRKSSIFRAAGEHGGGVLVDVHRNYGAGEEEEYRIEGSFPRRCCKVVYEGAGEGGEEAVVVAEIKRKVDPAAHVVLGKDVFSLCLRPGFDSAFAMGIVIVLDQITGGGNDDEEDVDMNDDINMAT